MCFTRFGMIWTYSFLLKILNGLPLLNFYIYDTDSLPLYNSPPTVECVVPNCSGNGICHLGNCVCYKGYKGSDCSLPDKLNFSHVCARNCSGHGVYDFEANVCQCERYFTGPDCEKGMTMDIHKLCSICIPSLHLDKMIDS